jgi:PhnB protein
MPRTLWTNTFREEKPNKTLVSIVATYENLADLEKVVKMGLKEGFTMALENFNELLLDA